MQHFICLGGGLHRQVVSLLNPLSVYHAAVTPPCSPRNTNPDRYKLPAEPIQVEHYHLRSFVVPFTITSSFLSMGKCTIDKKVRLYAHESLNDYSDGTTLRALDLARRDPVFEERLFQCAFDSYGM